MSTDKPFERPGGKYPPVPCKAPGRLYFVGEVGKMKFVDQANREGWYNRFDAATGKFRQIDGKFSAYTNKFDYGQTPSSSARAEKKYYEREGEASARYGLGPSARTQRSEGMDLSSLEYTDRNSPDRPPSTLDTCRAHTQLVELTEKKKNLNKKLQIVEAALEAEKRKYLKDFSLSGQELMAAEKSPAKKSVLSRSRREGGYGATGSLRRGHLNR